jgi:hypothetical protein
MILFRYLDVLLVVVAAPILLLIGVPAVGYGVGAGTWIALRAVGVAVDRYAPASGNRNAELTLRLVYLISRIFALALAVILVRNAEGKNDGLAALGVVVFAFTINLALSYVNRPGSR